MYKCGWNGCEKAYGTLNHLNAHVTMQSHGQKRTPEGMSAFLRKVGTLLHLTAVFRFDHLVNFWSQIFFILETLFHLCLSPLRYFSQIKCS
jgi:hypothetical protein